MQRLAHGNWSFVLDGALAAFARKGHSRICAIGRVKDRPRKIRQTELKPGRHAATKLISDRSIRGSEETSPLEDVLYVAAAPGNPTADHIAKARDRRSCLSLDDIVAR